MGKINNRWDNKKTNSERIDLNLTKGNDRG